MRAPGTASPRPASPRSRVAIAASSPVREPATPAVNALAMAPGPMMPQRIFRCEEVMSVSVRPLGRLWVREGRSADAHAAAVEKQRALRLDRYGEEVALAAAARILALDDQLLF